MKYIVTENQYKILLREDRVDYLRNQFVIDPTLLDDSTEGSNDREEFEDGDRQPGGIRKPKNKIEPIQDHNGVDIAYVITNKKGNTKVSLSDEIFTDIVEADPTTKKEFVQWMVTVFMRLLKNGEIDQAVRFITEDLPEANEYLGIFEKVRKKKIFKTGAPNRPNAPENVSDITQYDNLGHLYSIVSPFIGEDKEEGELYGLLKKYIDLGHAKLVYRDNDVLVYMPQTIESSCEPLGDLASWCTRGKGNSYFDRYRNDKRKPDGSLSDYYVVMPKKLFGGDDEGIYPLQFHFESGQLHDKNNNSIESDKLPEVLSRFGGLTEFFKKELGALATIDIQQGAGLMDSKYLKYLNKFGGDMKDVINDEVWDEGVASIRRLAGEQQVPLQQNKYLKWLMSNTEGVNVVDYLDESTTTLDFSNMDLGTPPDLSRFNNLRRLTLGNCKLNELPSVDMLPSPNDIVTISFSNNNITDVGMEGYSNILDKCFLINLDGNPINRINVEELEKLVNDSGLARLTYDDNILENLTPENRLEFEKFQTDGKKLGYFFGNG
jgi:hypothetical protein